MTADADFVRQVQGYGLTTARIFYRMPDCRSVIQEFIWQRYDLYPRFPELHRFLRFWETRIEGPLHSVLVAHHRLIGPSELRSIDGAFTLN